MIRIDTRGPDVNAESVTIRPDGHHECVRATGATLTEAIENLVKRFKDLQDATLTELHELGFIRVGTREEAS